MPESLDARIAKLLDQLNNQALTESEVKKIKDKVAFLEAQRERAS